MFHFDTLIRMMSSMLTLVVGIGNTGFASNVRRRDIDGAVFDEQGIDSAMGL
jgi:hypothetical protein